MRRSSHRRAVHSVVAVLAVVLSATAGHAQAPKLQVVDLWTGPAPGFERAGQVEVVTTLPDGEPAIIRNVTVPTLTVFPADPAVATGAAVIVAPGGALRFLSMDAEGAAAARALAARGVTAFVLKYRTVATPANEIAAALQTAVVFARLARGETEAVLADGAEPAIADGRQALALVRARASEWGVDPNRIGVLGFSAGGFIFASILRDSAEGDQPAFAGLVYGATFNTTDILPASLPPVFLAVARDDALAYDAVIAFHAATVAAGLPGDLHVYDSGGHGFGMNRQGTSSDGWAADFLDWLEAIGYAARHE